MTSEAADGSTGTLVETSRARRDETIPARIAVPSSLGGSRWGWGDLFTAHAAFILLFILVGISLAALGVWGRFIAPPERAESLADPRFYLAAMAFGFVFVLVPVAMLRMVLTSQAASRRFGARPAGQGPPWTWDHPWQPEGMGPDYKTRGGSLGMLAVLSLIALFNIALSAPSWIFRIIILAFDALGLLILYSWVTTLINAVRFRRTTIAWRTFPAHRGQPLQATVRFAAPIEAKGPASVTLRCLRDTPDTSAQHTAGAVRPVSIFRETRELTTSGPLASLDLVFQVPSDLPGTDLSREDAVYWQVVVRVPVSGPDFEAVFLAPVY